MSVVSNINLFKPDFMIDCSKLKQASDVYGIMKKNGIKKMYCYTFFYRKDMLTFDILKIGESCPSPSPGTNAAIAERLGRQIAWLEGWNDQPKSDNGIDFSLNIKREIQKGNLPTNVVNRNNICIGVWNLDIRPVLVFVEKDRSVTTWAEGTLAQQYKNNNGDRLPLLNYKDPTKNTAFCKSFVSIAHFDDIFTQNC